MKFIINSLVFSTSIVTILSCDRANEIGLDLQGNIPVSTYFTDTLTVKSSSALQDSMFTSGTTGVVVGKALDPVMGTVQSKAFFQVGLPVNTDATAFKFDLDISKYTLDSVSLNLAFNSFVYGDTLGTLGLQVHRLKDDLKPLKRYAGYETLGYFDAPIGGKNFKMSDLRNTKGDTTKSIRIPIDKSFGEAIWNLAQKDETSEIAKFTAYLKGLVIVPTSNTNMLATFKFSDDASTYSGLTFYYHETGQTTAISSRFSLSRIRFSNVTSVKNGQAIEKLFPRGKNVPAKNTQGLTYIQAGTGLVTRLEIPAIDFIKNRGKVAINKAVITIEPLANSYDKQFSLPASLEISETEKTANNEVYRNAAGVAYKASSTFYNATTNQYSFNITDYVQSLYAGRKGSKTLLINVPTNDNTHRVVVDAAKTKIRLFYTTDN